MKKRLAVGILTTAIVATTMTPLVAVQAQTVSSSSSSSTVSSLASNAAARQQTRIDRIKSRADMEIDRRVNSLKELVDKISDIKKLSDSQKSTLKNSVNTEITNLTTLKAKIDADTDLNTLINDAKSVIQSYRVYAVYIPEIRIVISADKMNDLTNLFNQLLPRLNTRIQAITDPTKKSNALAAYTDLQAKLADANTQYTNALNIALALTPAGYPDNKSQMITARDDLKAALQDFKTARQDVAKIRQNLGGANGSLASGQNSTSSTSSSTSSQG